MFIFTSCGVSEEISEPEVQRDDKIRGVWIYYNELSMKNEKSGTAEQFKKKIDCIFSDCSQWGLNTVFVQIRPFADSFYPSEVFPWSAYLTGEQGNPVDYDPLQIMVDVAKKYGLSFHAWINPFRISHNPGLNTLSENHPAHLLEKTDAVFEFDGGIYFNPASLEAQKLILEGISEIAENYDVDGIHIDDYFYPTTDDDIDKNQYQIYLEGGGELALAEWRIECINAFINGIYRTVKAIKPGLTVSISPAGNIENNYQKHFADVKTWSSREGFCDIIIPQIYFGFNHKTLPFKSCVSQWADLNTKSKIKLVCGIGAYRAVDPEADEWKNPDTVRQQAEYITSLSEYDGYCLFSYGSLAALESESELTSDKVSQQRSRD